MTSPPDYPLLGPPPTRTRCLSDISELVLLKQIRKGTQKERGRSNSAQSMPETGAVPEIVVTFIGPSVESAPVTRAPSPFREEEAEGDVSSTRKLSSTINISKSANELSISVDNTVDLTQKFSPDNPDNLPRCKSLETHSNVFDRDKNSSTLRRSNSMDNASQTSTLKSHQEFNITGLDSDFEVDDELKPWSSRHHVHASTLELQDMKRQDVIAEFVHTERTFLRCLLLLQKAYHEPLSTNNIISQSLLNRIFLNLSQLVDLHRAFKNELLYLQGKDEYIDSIGPCILTFLSNPDYQNAIVKYCINLTDSLMVLKENMKNTDFAAFLLECESNPLCRRKHLKELLPNPMQRVTKYPLLIAQIFKYTKVETEEQGRVLECLDKVKNICLNINKEVERAESHRIEKSARARLLAEDINREIGEVILNMPIYNDADDVKLEENLVLFEKYIVLFPNARSLLYSSTPSYTTDSLIEQSTKVLPLDNGDLLVSADSQEKKSFYLICKNKKSPLLYPIICKSEEDCILALRSLEGAINSKAGVAPKKGAELLDIQVAQEILERTRPAVTTPNTDSEGDCVSIYKRGRDLEFQSLNSNESSESSCSSFQQRIDKADEEIFSLLTFKLGLMQDYYGSRKLPPGARDLPQSFHQLISDAHALQEVALELTEQLTGEDKNTKLTKIRSSFQSLVSNAEFVSQSITVEYAGGEDRDPLARPSSGQQEEARIRRGSFFERWKPWRGSKEQDNHDNNTGVSRRSNKKYNTRARANTNSPLRLSPKSSTESLNKVTPNRLSSCSHHSTDSELEKDCSVEVAKRAPPVASGTRSLSKAASARTNPNRTSTFQDMFRRSTVVVEAERPVITGPVLQHTTNKQLAIDTG